MKENMNIHDIEALTQKDINAMLANNEAELIDIKGHNCYLVDFGSYFGYSVIVFKNGRHIRYANDYQLHHGHITKPELKAWYLETLNRKLFTESELLEDVTSYNDYSAKGYYLRNLWVMQFNYASAFCIGEPSKELKTAEKKMVYCPVCFCYVDDKTIVTKAVELLNHIENSFAILKQSDEVFTDMVTKELFNHEAGITYDYTDALRSLNLKFEELADTQKQIVKQQLEYVVEHTNC